MFPDSNHAPTLLFQRKSLSAIACDVSSDLFCPEGAVSSGPDIVFWTSMEETAINESSYSCGPENQIRSTDWRGSMKKIFDTFETKSSPKKELRGGMLCFDSSHLLASSQR